MANTKNDLLQLFAPNDTNNIQAAYLQQFVIDIYAQAVLIDDIVDDLTDAQGTSRVLSASRGAWLQTQIDGINTRLDSVEQSIADLDTRITALEP